MSSLYRRILIPLPTRRRAVEKLRSWFTPRPPFRTSTDCFLCWMEKSSLPLLTVSSTFFRISCRFSGAKWARVCIASRPTTRLCNSLWFPYSSWRHLPSSPLSIGKSALSVVGFCSCKWHCFSVWPPLSPVYMAFSFPVCVRANVCLPIVRLPLTSCSWSWAEAIPMSR